MRVKLVLGTVAVLGLVACGSSGDSEDQGASDAGGTGGGSGASGTSGGGGSGGGDPDAQIGIFGVQLIPPVAATATTMARNGSTTIVGSVGDKPETEAKIWELDSESDDCQLLIPRVPFCDPGCRSTEVCVEDGMCVEQRVAVDVGEVVVSGVMTTAGADSATLISARNVYQNGTTTLPFPAFAEGDPITLTASGAGAIAGFEIEANGIATLEVTPRDEYVISGDSDLVLQWEPPSDPGTSSILVKLDISHHGGEKGKIECATADDGELTVPKAMIADLIALGVAGFPTVVITRSAEGFAQLPNGRVRLRVYQYDERAVTIPGVVSCQSAAQCQSGETCRDDKTCG